MKIDTEHCTECGACIAECPTFAVKRDIRGLFIDNEKCIRCAHCAAVCPADAVTGCRTRPRRHINPGYENLLEFMLNKRSVRKYSGKPVLPEHISQIAASAMSAATASNTMDWQLHIYTGEKLEQLRKAMLDIFVRNGKLVNAVLTNPVFRLLARKTAARPYVIRKRTAETFQGYLEEIKNGRDPLLFGAPVMMVLTSPKHSANYGPVNCAIAGTQMMETALTMDIGSCMVGFAEYMINLFPKIKKMSGIGRGQKVFLVFTLGYSAVKFRSNPVREFPVFLNNAEFEVKI